MTRVPRLLLIPLAAVLATGCATIHFDYAPQGSGDIPDRHAVVAVGEVADDLGFKEPARVRFNVMLDRPVSQAVRDALAAELENAGFKIGDQSRRLVSAAVQQLGFDGTRPTIDFDILSLPQRQLLYRRRFETTTLAGNIWDQEGFINGIRGCLQQFVGDPQALAVLEEKAQPSAGGAAAAKPKDAAPWWSQGDEAAEPPAASFVPAESAVIEQLPPVRNAAGGGGPEPGGGK